MIFQIYLFRGKNSAFCLRQGSSIHDYNLRTKTGKFSKGNPVFDAEICSADMETINSARSWHMYLENLMHYANKNIPPNKKEKKKKDCAWRKYGYGRGKAAIAEKYSLDIQRRKVRKIFIIQKFKIHQN